VHVWGAHVLLDPHAALQALSEGPWDARFDVIMNNYFIESQTNITGRE